MDLVDVSIIVPLYNESAVFAELTDRLDATISQCNYRVEVVLVDDGSTDDTAHKMRSIALRDGKYTCVFLARNFGHQLALTAGMNRAEGTKAIMVIDGDLQDPPELLPKFFNKLQEGYDVVYAIRQNRKENFVKRLAYFTFYRIQRRLINIHTPLDSGDFCIMSRRMVDILNHMKEDSRFIRGMRSWVGFKQIGIFYDRKERSAGTSKYNLKMLFQLAYNGIFNFSDVPLKISTYIGLITLLTTLPYAASVLIKRLFFGGVIEGFTALLIAVVILGAAQLISIGILGEYLIRVFFQVKGRPLYIISEEIRRQESCRE